MPLKQFEFGVLRLSYKTSATTLRVTCSSIFDLPASIENDTNLDELVHLTTKGELWMAKATVCRMDVAASISPTLGSASPSLGSLVSAISKCPVSPLMLGFGNGALIPRRSGRRLVLHYGKNNLNSHNMGRLGCRSSSITPICVRSH